MADQLKANDGEERTGDSQSASIIVDFAERPGEVREDKEQIGGEVVTGPPRVKSAPRKKVRDRIVIHLLWLLSVFLVLHHVILGYFVYLGKTDIKSFENSFNSTLPVIAGLIGTAVAFYFKQ